MKDRIIPLDPPEGKIIIRVVIGSTLLFGLFLASRYNYLLFHSLAELFSIIVAYGIFMIFWNSRHLQENSYFLFIGIAYLFIGSLDLIHTLGYTGMNVFQGYDSNLPTQLWIASRYLEALSLLVALLFIKRKLKIYLVFFIYIIIFTLIIFSIFFWSIFPDCFIEGSGLTPFKKMCEYVISLILLSSIILLLQKRSAFDGNVFRLLIYSISLTIASELSFTFYVHAYGFSNLIGHYLKILSFYLIYRAIIVTGLMKPYSLLFRDLKLSEEALRESEQRIKMLFSHMSSGVAVYQAIDDGDDFIIKDLNRSGEKIEQLKRKDVMGRPLTEVFPQVKKFGIFEALQRVWRTGNSEYFSSVFHRDDSDPGNWRENWVYKLPSGEMVSVYNDITDRKRAEEQIRISLEEKETLLKEIHHRIKNNFSIITSLISLQQNRIKDYESKKIIKDIQSRMRTMALIHEKLYQSSDVKSVDFGEYIKMISNELYGNYVTNPEKVVLNTDVEDIQLNTEQALHCGIVLNELLTNSFKYAFPAEREKRGEITVSLHSKNKNLIELIVADNGKGIPASVDIEKSDTLGLKLVSTLASHLKGRLELDRERGTRFTITFHKQL
jgi:two-component sensor histidine kinase/PAS domain-containing protein